MENRCFTKEGWRALHPQLHWIFQVFPFLSQHNLEPDELHVLYLGTLPLLLGSVLWLLCYQSQPLPAEECMSQVWAHISKTYSDRCVKTQFSALSLASFTIVDKPRADYPELKGKGLEVRDLLHPLLDAWKAFRNANTWNFELVEALLEHQLSMVEILHSHRDSLFFPEEVAQRFCELNDQVLEWYTELARRSDAAGMFLWKVVPNHRWQWHWAQRSR